MVTRRTAIKAAGATVGLFALSGTVLASDVDQKSIRATADGNPRTAIRVGHFSPGAPNVDVFVDGERIAGNLAFSDVSGYVDIGVGTQNVVVTRTSDPDAVLWERDMWMGNAFYTVAAVGNPADDTFRAKIVRDQGSALLRVFHASPDVPAVDVFANGVRLATNVEFSDRSDYVPLPESSYDLDVRRAGTDESLVTFNVTVNQGVAYTGYVTAPDDLRVVVDGP